MFCRFFRNKGAVAGVFIIVGLTAASIVLFLFFYIRRRRRNQRLEHDAAVASTLAAAGYNRRPLDGDDDEEKALGQPSTPAPSATISTMHNSNASLAALNLYAATGLRPPAGEGNADASGSGAGADFDPYAVPSAGGDPVSPPPPAQRKDGYVAARTSSPPPPGAYTRRPAHSSTTSTSSMGWGHAAKGSISSTEPLLSGYFGGAATEPSTPALGPTLNLAGGSGADAERPKGITRQSASTMSIYSVDEPEELDTRGKLEVRSKFCATISTTSS